VRRWAIALALAVVAAGLAAARPSHTEPAFSVPAVEHAKPLFGIAGEWRDQKLVRLDPRSLRPLPGPKLEIFNGVTAWAFSPNRSRLALGTACQAGISLGTLQLVDVRPMRPVGCFAIGDLRAIAWPTPNRLLAVAHSPLQVVLIDARARRIIRRTPLDGVWLSAARAGDRLLVLTGRSFAEPERLVVVDMRGSVGAVDVQAPHASDFVVDPEGRRAYLVSGATVAEVDLDNLSVAYHELHERRSLFGRVLAWLVPSAQAKELHREMRRTLWVGDGLIASFGSDVTTDGRRFTSVPVGLRLIDTRTWTVRMVDEQVGFALLAGDVLLAAGAKEIGLVAYELNGTKRYQLFRGRSLAPVESYQGKAWIEVGRPAPQVLDVRTGRVIGPRRAPLPTLLIER
jgi:hypothetical protein